MGTGITGQTARPVLQGFLVYFFVLTAPAFFPYHFAGSRSLGRSVLFQFLLVLGIPLLTSLWFRLRLRSVYKLYHSSIPDLLLTLLLTMFVVFLLEEVNLIQSQYLPETKRFNQQLEVVLSATSRSHFLRILLAMAVVPAICEEFLFRGFLIDRLSFSQSGWTTILLTSFLFGFFHQSLPSLLPATLAGVMLGFIVLRTGSLINVIASHFTVNAWTIVVVNTPLRTWFPWMAGERHVPLVVLILCLVGIWFSGKGLGCQERLWKVSIPWKC